MTGQFSVPYNQILFVRYLQLTGDWYSRYLITLPLSLLIKLFFSLLMGCLSPAATIVLILKETAQYKI